MRRQGGANPVSSSRSCPSRYLQPRALKGSYPLRSWVFLRLSPLPVFSLRLPIADQFSHRSLFRRSCGTYSARVIVLQGIGPLLRARKEGARYHAVGPPTGEESAHRLSGRYPSQRLLSYPGLIGDGPAVLLIRAAFLESARTECGWHWGTPDSSDQVALSDAVAEIRASRPSFARDRSQQRSRRSGRGTPLHRYPTTGTDVRQARATKVCPVCRALDTMG